MRACLRFFVVGRPVFWVDSAEAAVKLCKENINNSVRSTRDLLELQRVEPLRTTACVVHIDAQLTLQNNFYFLAPRR